MRFTSSRNKIRYIADLPKRLVHIKYLNMFNMVQIPHLTIEVIAAAVLHTHIHIDRDLWL